MYNSKIVYFNLIIICASVICFEIISTRISSNIFVNLYANILISQAIFGLSCGDIFSYYKINKTETAELSKVIIETIF